MTPASDTATPRVSVLVPAFNAAATLRETLASVQQQSFKDFEVVVVDDGSSDDSADIAAAFAAADQRFTLIRQENAGVAAARNAALAASRGSWVAPLDADDLWHPDKLARQLRRLESAVPETVLVYSWSVDIDQSSHVVSRRLDLDWFEGDVYAALVYTNFIGNASAPLIRRDVLLSVGGWDPGLRSCRAQGCEDWLLYLQLAERGSVALAPGFLVGYRQSTGSMSRNDTEMERSYRLVLERARMSHAELPRSLFRWSRAAYDLYRFETLYQGGAKLESLGPLLAGVLRDPVWLTRASTRRKLRRWLRSLVARQAPPPRAGPSEHFYAACPEPPYALGEGRWHDVRRRRLSATRSARRA